MRGSIGRRQSLADIQRSRIDQAAQKAEIKTGSHDEGWPHYSAAGNCLCTCRHCIGGSGCICRGCSHASHPRKKKAS